MYKNMKKMLIPLLLLSLTACNGNENPSDSSTGPITIEVNKKYTLSCHAATGTTIQIHNPSSDAKYESGSLVSFQVTVDDANKELKSVTINDKIIAPTEGNSYEIVMPNMDATIATEVNVLGEETILNVSDVVEDAVPKTVEELHTLLQASKTTESLYLANATFESTYGNSSMVSLSLNAKVYWNDAVFIDGHYLKYDTSDMAFYTGEERGITGQKYYSVKTDTAVTTLEQTGVLKAIVPDTTETLLNHQIKESDAKVNASSAGFIDLLLDRTFSPTSSSSFLTTSNYGWKNITLNTVTDVSNKFYTVTVTAVYPDYNRTYTYVLTTVIDGDSFVKSADFVANTYAKDDFNAETNWVYDGSEVLDTKTIHVVQERNYRHSTTEKLDLEKHVMTDYDVVTSYQLTGQTAVTATDHVVENSSKLTFRFRQRDNTPVMFVPTLVGAKEDGFITFNEDGAPIVNQEGPFTLIFDNGLGELKEVAMESVQPLPFKIEISLPGNKVFNGETNILTASISPSGADQSVTVTPLSSSTGAVDIVDNHDNTFTLTGVTNGSVTLEVASTIKPELTSTITFTVENKPNRDNILAFLTTTTLKGTLSGWGSHYVNLYMDGTGEYVCYEGSKGDVIPFTWELTESFEISIVVDGTLKSKYYNFVGITNVSETTASLIFAYNGTNREAVLSPLDEKLDFATASLN